MDRSVSWKNVRLWPYKAHHSKVKNLQWQRFPRRFTGRGEKSWLTARTAGNQMPKFFAHIMRHSKHAAETCGGFLTLSDNFHEASVQTYTYK